ncbi:MAG: hypothetical protein E7172_02880 [Firmicutes bacterium]|nr:hypothetical protein [Bacillota bacterium]
MKKVTIIYDDIIEVTPRIKTIIGKNSYGDIVLKRKSLFTSFSQIINDSKIDCQIIRINNKKDLDDLLLKNFDDKIIFHYFSNNPISKVKEFELFLKKIEYSNDNFIVSNNSIVGLIFSKSNDYQMFLNNYKENKNIEDYISYEKLEIDACLDISLYQNLLYYITGGFDARYFNQISGDEYTVVKNSQDKKKIKMEYMYYQLLPDEMKSWIVMPYNYVEQDNKASYTMERMPMTDIAIRWTHKAIEKEELLAILEKSFHFINKRPSKKVSKEEYNKISNKLYIEKLDDRVKKLKNLPEYKKIKLLIQSGTEYNDIDEIIAIYKELYYKLISKDKLNEMVIGHGDLFFANMLYSKELNMLKLIDPKGALEEKDLWMHPYYDIAKLSHSICGNYDFFNTDGFSILLNKEMKFDLQIHFDNKEYVELFKNELVKNNYNYELVRIYEASLFLSMLPLHIDNPQKVFGFILNALNILKELR